MSNQYRKKPVVIQAVQFTEAMRDANLFDGKPLPEGMKRGRADYHPGRRQVYSSYFYIETLEGRMEVSVGDWIITGVKGEHYPCKPDIFAATYEDVAARELDVEAERRAYIKACPWSVWTVNAWTARQEQEFKVWLAARRASPAPVSTEQAGDAWRLVPINPTPEMLSAARNAPLPMVALDSISAQQDLMNKSRYTAMLGAAPSPNKSPIGADKELK